MKLKLTQSEFSALYTLLAAICTGISPKGIEAQVLHGVLCRLYKKFYVKNFRPKKKYGISIEADEACAFHMFISRYGLSGYDTFTHNLVHQLTNSIHQKYSA